MEGKMKVKQFLVIVPIVLSAMLVYSNADAQFRIDVETGGVFSGYNDVRIPNATGTLISLSEELETDAKVFVRIRCLYTFKDRHTVLVLAAPLSLKASGQVDRDVHFEGKTFAANTPLDATFRFNSYRATYRYELKNTERTQIGLGITAKIRDAEVSFRGGGDSSVKTNVGFVPLLHFHFRQMLWSKLYFILDGDAAAASQGRAEDILAALVFHVSPRVGIKLGYRLLEGGADVDEVYNFTWLNYAVAGVVLQF